MPEQLINHGLPWHPFYLTRPVLFALTVVFFATLAAVEALFVVSKKLDCIGDEGRGQRYLWAYGPTAYFTLLAAVWARVEYQSKFFAPWIHLAGGFSPPKYNLLLDYVSDFQVVVVFKALRNKDVLVSATVTISLLIKTLIIISTALTTLTWIPFDQHNQTVAVQGRFVDVLSPVIPTALAYYIIKGINAYGLDYPAGLSNEYAFQPIASDLLEGRKLGQAEVRTSVDAAETIFECQYVDLRLDSYKFLGLLDSDKPGTYRAELNFTFSTPGCGQQTIPLYQVWHCERATARKWRETCAVISSRLAKVICSSHFNMLAMFWNLTIVDHTREGSSAEPVRIEVQRTNQILCEPQAKHIKVDTAYNASNWMKPLTVHPSLDSPHGHYLSNEATAAVMNTWLDSHGLSNDLNSSVSARLSNFTVDADLIMGNALDQWRKQHPGISEASFFEVKHLQDALTAYVKQCAAVVLKYYTMETASTEVQASITRNEKRHVVQPWVAQCMAVLVGLCAALSMFAIVLVPEYGILPCDPTNLIGVASLIAHSPGFRARLRNIGTTDRAPLVDLLRYAEFKSEVNQETCSRRPLFSICEIGIGTEKHGILSDPQHQTQNLKRPFFLRTSIRLCSCFTLAGLIIILEALVRKSIAESGLANVAGDNTRYIHYLWTALPALLLGLASALLSSTDFTTRCLGPYVSLKQGKPVSVVTGLDLLDACLPRVIYRELRLKNLSAFLMTSAFLLGSLLSTLSASLYHVVPVVYTSPTMLKVSQFLNVTPGGGREETEILSSLILQPNIPFPKFTSNQFVLPTLEVTELDPGIQAASKASLSVGATVPALRAKMDCRLYNQSDIDTEYTIMGASASSKISYLKIFIRGEKCLANGNLSDSDAFYNFALFKVWSLESQYFGVSGSTRPEVATHKLDTLGCSDLLYAWGQPERLMLDDGVSFTYSGGLLHAAAMGCNLTHEAVDVKVNFTGADLRLDPDRPPQPREDTARPIHLSNFSRGAAFRTLESFYEDQEMKNAFFSMLTGSPWAIPEPYLGNQSRDNDVVEAIKFHHQIVEAQLLSMGRISATEANTTAAVNLGPDPTKLQDGYSATVADATRTRVAQDPVSTRVLEGLLGSILVLFILSWMLMPNTDELLTCQAPTIASVATLIACGNLCEVLPPDAAWMSMPEIIASFPSSTFLQMRWSKTQIPVSEEGGGWGSPGDITSESEIRIDEQGQKKQGFKTGDSFGVVAVFEKSTDSANWVYC